MLICDYYLDEQNVYESETFVSYRVHFLL